MVVRLPTLRMAVVDPFGNRTFLGKVKEILRPGGIDLVAEIKLHGSGVYVEVELHVGGRRYARQKFKPPLRYRPDHVDMRFAWNIDAKTAGALEAWRRAPLANPLPSSLTSPYETLGD